MTRETKRRKDGSFVHDLAVAVGFLTAIPVPDRAYSASGSFGRSFSWFPLVGLLIGVMLALAAAALTNFLPAGVVAALLVALWISLTGGLHLDGLMDSCDGLFLMKTPEERLEVMRDSRVGAFGTLGAVCVLLVKFTALSYLLETGGGAGLTGLTALTALVVSPVLGRWAMTFAVVAFPYYGHGETLGAAFTRDASGRQLTIASVSAGAVLLAPGLLSGSLPPVAALAAAASVTLAVTCGFAWFATGRLGGLTGDVYGAVGEVVEVAVLISFVSLVFVGWVDV